jgi:O-acetylserine/cysteine efflux transporter
MRWSDGTFGVLTQIRSIDATALLAGAYVALLATWLPWALWRQLLQRHAPGRVMPFSLRVPVVGLWTAFVFPGEKPLPLPWVEAGAGEVLGGLVVNPAGRWRVTRLGAARIEPGSSIESQLVVISGAPR